MGRRTPCADTNDANLLREVRAPGRIARAHVCKYVRGSSRASCKVAFGSLLRSSVLQRAIRRVPAHAVTASRQMHHRGYACEVGFLAAAVREGGWPAERR